MMVAATILIFVLLFLISITDIRINKIPDFLSYGLASFGLVYTAWADVHDFPFNAAAWLLGYLTLWLVSTLYRQRRGFDGLGLGDAKLFAAGGAWLGPMYLAPILLAATLLALAAVLIRRLSGRHLDWQTRLPFGPFLSVAIFGAWCVKISA